MGWFSLGLHEAVAPEHLGDTLGIAIGAVVGVTALDILCGVQLSRSGSQA